jgi:hypothetical protein
VRIGDSASNKEDQLTRKSRPQGTHFIQNTTQTPGNIAHNVSLEKKRDSWYLGIPDVRFVVIRLLVVDLRRHVLRGANPCGSKIVLVAGNKTTKIQEM